MRFSIRSTWEVDSEVAEHSFVCGFKRSMDNDIEVEKLEFDRGEFSCSATRTRRWKILQ